MGFDCVLYLRMISKEQVSWCSAVQFAMLRVDLLRRHVE